jgi:periplasmic protein TonB
MSAIAAPRTAFDVSPLRIGSWSTALALHALAFALLVLPPQLPLAELQQAEPKDLIVDIVRTVVPKQEPVPPIPPPPRRPPPPQRTTPVPVAQPVVLAESAMPVAVQPVEVTLSVEPTGPAEPAVSRGAEIAYDRAPPPPYPPLARRRGWEGEVLLRVRVGKDGAPIEVVVERSSGQRLLDRAASEHVLAKWRFQPALQAGRATEAWARVPISFRIERF